MHVPHVTDSVGINSEENLSAGMTTQIQMIPEEHMKSYRGISLTTIQMVYTCNLKMLNRLLPKCRCVHPKLTQRPFNK